MTSEYVCTMKLQPAGLFLYFDFVVPHCKPKPCKAYRELPVIQLLQEKPVFITGNPVFIAGIVFSLQGFPCKSLYFSVGDCSVE